MKVRNSTIQTFRNCIYCLDGQHHDLDEFSALQDDDDDDDDDERDDEKHEDKDKKDEKSEKDDEKEHGMRIGLSISV